jgi:hypothetical protein
LCRHLNNRCEVVFNPSKSKRNKNKKLRSPHLVVVVVLMMASGRAMD